MNKNKLIHEKLEMGCWHTLDKKLLKCKCGVKGPSANPDYSLDEWIPRLIKRLKELNSWKGFHLYAERAYPRMTINVQPYNLTSWLVQQPRFRDLLYDYLKEKENINEKVNSS